MATTASAVCDALITMLTATSMFGASGAGITYKTLEVFTGSAGAVVSFAGLNSTLAAFGNPAVRDRLWTFSVTLWIKDTGNPVTAMSRVGKVTDATVACIESDDDLLGTVDTVLSVNAIRDPDRAFDSGGATWLPVNVTITTKEL